VDSKICSTCKEEKLLVDFHKGNAKFGRRSKCKSCIRTINALYNSKKDKGKERVRALRYLNKHLDEPRKYVTNLLKSSSCIDCGETNPITLQFDHVRGKKKYDISSLLARRHANKMKLLLAEIDKCEIRCANCHSIKTAKERNYWILRYL
jgi:hypothetical protein